LPIDAGTYDLHVLLAGTDTVALGVPGLVLADGTVYTVFAMGLAGFEPTPMAIPSVDAVPSTMLPETGGVNIASLVSPIALALGALLIVVGFAFRKQSVSSQLYFYSCAFTLSSWSRKG